MLPAMRKSPSTVKGVKFPDESPIVKPASELKLGQLLIRHFESATYPTLTTLKRMGPVLSS